MQHRLGTTQLHELHNFVDFLYGWPQSNLKCRLC